MAGGVPQDFITYPLDFGEMPRTEKENGATLIVLRVPCFQGETADVPYTTVPLGIILLPSRYKLCSFDCLYCHYGRTQVKTLSPGEEHRPDLPSVPAVLQAVEEALRTRRDFDYLTFSGNGEPTLHPHFPEIVSGVSSLRDQFRPEVKLAILSNSTTVHFSPIQEALTLFDAPIMKLDAGDQRTLAGLNRPTGRGQAGAHYRRVEARSWPGHPERAGGWPGEQRPGRGFGDLAGRPCCRQPAPGADLQHRPPCGRGWRGEGATRCPAAHGHRD